MDSSDQQPKLSSLDEAPAAPVSGIVFAIEGPYDAPADDYQPGGEGFKIHALRDNVDVGHVELTILHEDKELFVNWVEVPEEFRRQGIATALCTHALGHWPGFQLGTSGLTDDGEEFWPTLDAIELGPHYDR